MSAFQKLLSPKTSPARRIVTFPPSAFAETWSRRPQGPTKLGLRSIGETELEIAESEAVKTAWKAYPKPGSSSEERIALCNDHVMTNVLARVTVRAEDASVPYFDPVPESLIRVGLTPGAIRRLWDEYARLSIEDGPLTPEASDEELEALGAALATCVAGLSAGPRARVRKLAKAIIDEIEAAKIATPAERVG